MVRSHWRHAIDSAAPAGLFMPCWDILTRVAAARVHGGQRQMDSWPNRVERYRREAERLRAEAGKADPYTRQQLLNVARQYERLATSIERLPQRPK
jgi:hypothetical protein